MAQEHSQLVLQAAREGIVLLRNEKKLLPLKKDIRSIAVIGPDADAPIDQLGDYFPHNVPREVVTVLEGIKNKVTPKTKVTYVKGCEVIGNKLNEIDKAKTAAKNADIAIVVIGEAGYVTNGEGRDVASLDLTGTPLYEFGFGLSYTTFEYSNLVIQPLEINSEGEIYITVDVKYTGTVSGEEVVKLYINDVISSTSRPVKKLKGYEKISLEPGEKKSVKLKLQPEELSMLDRDMNLVVESGTFKVMIGSSSNDIKLKGAFEVKK